MVMGELPLLQGGGGYNGWNLSLTSYLHLVSKSRMRGTLPPSLTFLPWCLEIWSLHWYFEPCAVLWLILERCSVLWFILQCVRKVWNQWEFYLLFIIYIICSICSPRHCTHFLSRFTTFVRILLDIFGSTGAQQSNSLPKVTKISDFNSIDHPWRPLRSTTPPFYPMLMSFLAF
jgi:hypothetical protein